MRPGAARAELDNVLRTLEALQINRHVFHGKERVVITSLGASPPPDVLATLEVLPGVDRVAPLTSRYKLASREGHPETSVVEVGGTAFGRAEFPIVAGPTHLSHGARLRALREAIAPTGAAILRAGDEGDAHVLEAEQDGLGRGGMPVLAAVGEASDVLQVAAVADVLQVSAHNMQNLPLLRAVGRARRPVLLERGLSATVEEWLVAAEQVLLAGNFDVVLCERGIRTYEADRQATLDLSAIPVLKRLSHLPVVVNVSEGTGHRYMIKPMALAAAAAGADGLVVEVHQSGASDLTEGPGSLTLEEFGELTAALRPLLAALGRSLP
jgi:3-deoxy-7-phosphoheptulonate synthase